jgi:hypothetical protein
MTREEILALEGLELRKAVAEARGYTVRESYGNFLLYAPDGRVVFLAIAKTAEGAWRFTPDYPVNDYAAMSLLKVMRDSCRIEGDEVSVVLTLYSDGSYRVSVGRMSFDPGEVVVCGDELQPTICRAYLLAKAVQP